MAAIKGLSASGDWYERLRNIYSDRRKTGTDIFKSLGCHVLPDQTGLFVWGKIPDTYPDSISFSDFLCDEMGIFVAPGEIFGSMGKRYVRLSLCTSNIILESVLNKIQKQVAIGGR